MAPKEKDTIPISAPLSFDDDDQDEDFVASETESVNSDTDGDSSDSDASSEEGSDAEEEEEDDEEDQADAEPTVPPPGPAVVIPNQLQGALLEALQGQNILGDGEGEEEEEILSDSELSKQFPEEEDDWRGALHGLNSDSEGDEDEDEEEVSSDASVSEDSAGGAQQAVSLAAAQSAAAPAGGLSSHRRNNASSLGAAEEASNLQNRPLSPYKPLLDQLREEGGATSPPMELFGAVLSPLENSEAAVPIAQRTRAHINLMDVTLDELEAAFPTAHEPLLFFEVDDNAEYQRFLESIHGDLGLGSGGEGEGGGPGGGDVAAMEAEFEDSDDEDFMVELERMLALEEQRQGVRARTRTARATAGKNSYKRRAPKPPPRRSERLRKVTSERPLLLASRLDKRTAQAGAAAALLHNGNGAAGASGAAALPMLSGLEELASLAAAMDVGPPVPLPSDLGKPGAAAAAEMVVWRAPLPKTVRHFEIQSAADDSAPPTAAHIQSSQYSELYCLVHQHVQLLAQSVALAAAQGDTASAQAAAKMLRELADFVTKSTNKRMNGGIPPYVASCLGIEAGEGSTGDGGGGTGGIIRSNGNKRARTAGIFDLSQGRTTAAAAGGTNTAAELISWRPSNPGVVYTVADVAVLRAAPQMLDEMPGLIQEESPPPPPRVFPNSSLPEGMPSPESIDLAPLDLHLEDLMESTAHRGRKRRRGKIPEECKIWENLPADVAMAIMPMRRFFDPGLEPNPPEFLMTAQTGFTPGEDALLAWGIRKYVYDWSRIRKEFLPTKTDKVLFTRKKNRVAGNAPDNLVKQVVSLITGDLTPAEEILITQALGFYGKQAKKWEMICREHLPHRHPQVLSMLWGDKRSGRGSGGGGQASAGRGRNRGGARRNIQPALLQGSGVGVGGRLSAPSGAMLTGHVDGSGGGAQNGGIDFASIPPAFAAQMMAGMFPGGFAAMAGGMMPPPLIHSFPLQMASVNQAAAMAAAAAGTMPPPQGAIGTFQTAPNLAIAFGQVNRQGGALPMSPERLMPQEYAAAAASAAAAAAFGSPRPPSPSVLPRHASTNQGNGAAPDATQTQQQQVNPQPVPLNYASQLHDILMGKVATTVPENGASGLIYRRTASQQNGGPHGVPPQGAQTATGHQVLAPGGIAAQQDTPHAVPAMPAWSAEEEKLILRAALAGGGTLSETQVADFSGKLSRGRDEVVAKCLTLVERFREKARQRKQQGGQAG